MDLCPCGAPARWRDRAPGHPNAGYRAYCEACVPALPDKWTREELEASPARGNERVRARASRLLR